MGRSGGTGRTSGPTTRRSTSIAWPRSAATCFATARVRQAVRGARRRDSRGKSARRFARRRRRTATTRPPRRSASRRARPRRSRRQQREWGEYFGGRNAGPGLPPRYIRNRAELDALAAYFAWATWATVANRPGKDYSYTNNWPYEPLVGNGPTASTYLWSALSLDHAPRRSRARPLRVRQVRLPRVER